MFYLTFVKGIIDGTEGREVIKFSDIISAKASLHTKLGSAMSDTNCSWAFAVINNALGQQMVKDSFVRPTEETTEA